MRKSLLGMAVGLSMIAGIGNAQNHPNGYAGGGINFSKLNTEPIVYIVDGTGSLVTVATSGANNCHGMVMGPNNQLLYSTSLDGSIYMIDPVTGANIGTFVTVGVNLRDIAIDHNGDFFTGDTSPNDAVYKIDGATKAITTLYPFGAGWDPGEGGINIDIDTGEILVLGDGNGDNLWRMNRDGSGFTTVATGMVTRFGHAQHIPTGDIYGGTGGSNFLMRLPSGSAVPTVFISTAAGDNMYCCKCDRASSTNQQIVGGLWQNSSGLQGMHAVDIGSKAITTINSLTGLASSVSLYELEILYRRNVHSNAAGVGQWSVGIYIPEDAGKPYVLAVGTSGVRPGVAFPSGRVAYLNPDAVTFTGLLTGLAPFVTNTTGTLDASGGATATLDLSSLGSAVNGTRIWFLAVTLDNSAPDGLATVTDPHVVVAEGL